MWWNYRNIFICFAWELRELTPYHWKMLIIFKYIKMSSWKSDLYITVQVQYILFNFIFNLLLYLALIWIKCETNELLNVNKCKYINVIAIWENLTRTCMVIMFKLLKRSRMIFFFSNIKRSDQNVYWNVVSKSRVRVLCFRCSNSPITFREFAKKNTKFAKRYLRIETRNAVSGILYIPNSTHFSETFRDVQ